MRLREEYGDEAKLNTIKFPIPQNSDVHNYYNDIVHVHVCDFIVQPNSMGIDLRDVNEKFYLKVKELNMVR